jgi:serine/threonine protein kinase/dipeptidyl aminopeptidase/acylaminoacyl peptidase
MVSELSPGMLVGRYRLVRRLAEGGMGSVWAARDEQLDREVAVKLLPRLFLKDPSAERRFGREARAMGRLQHPNVVAVHDVGTADPGTGEELPFLVMELIAGRSLDDLIRDGPLHPRRAARIMQQVALALSAAHAAGVIHRDLKPSNVMVSGDGHVKVLDFGLARLSQTETRSADDTLTTPGMVLGSCPYMSPEQALGQAVSEHSDLFSFGAVLYETLSGSRAFEGGTPMRVLQSVVKCDFRPLEGVAPDLPPGLVAVVERCLKREPGQRYQDAASLTRDLEAFLESDEIRVAEHPTIRVSSDSIRALTLKQKRLRNIRVGLVVAGLAVGAAAGVLFGRHGREPLRPDPGRWSVRELMRFDGLMRGPSWSPDGRTIALDRRIPGRSEIVAFDLETERTRVLLEGGVGVAVTSPRISPDGRAILVEATSGTGTGLRIIPVTGGEPVARIGDALGGAWIAPGEVVFSRRQGGAPAELWTWHVDTGESTVRLPASAGRQWFVARPRPGGGLAATGGTSDPASEVFLVDTRGGVSELFSADRRLTGFEWMPSGRSLVVSRGGQLERASVDGVVPVLPRSERLLDPAPSPDGHRLAVIRQTQFNDLIAVDLDGGGWSCLVCQVPDSGWGSVAIDGAVAYRRTISGTSSVFLLEPDGNERRMTPPDHDASCPAFSPDGRRVAYLVQTSTGTSLAVVSRDGGQSVILVDGIEPSEYPSWSPDGSRIAFAAGDPLQVHVVSAAGGAVAIVTPDGGDYPVWSPDGSMIAYSVWTDDSDPDQGAWVVPVTGGEVIKVGSEPTRLVWSLDGRRLFQLRRSGDRLELWQAEVGGWSWRKRSVLDLGISPSFHVEHLPLTVDPSNGRLIVNRRTSSSALIVFDGLDPERW